jgi:hypothetical protein
MGIMAAAIKWGFAGVVVAASLAAQSGWAQTAPAAVPVPFSVDVAGTGTSAVTTCTTGIPTVSGVSYGDGCPGPTAGLSSPQGAAVDKYGNVYVADYSDRLVRVVYNGGAALAAAITAANSGYIISATRNAPAPTPVVGDIYTIAGVGITPAALTATQTDGKFSCANYAATGQAEALNSLGDGCPAASAPIGPRDISVDNDGNLFLTDYTNSRVRVLCVNCAATTLAAQLIVLENPGVTPVNGAMYTIAGYAGGYRDAAIGFGGATAATVSVALLRSPTAAVVSSADDVYIGDNLNNAVRLLYNGGTVAKNILTAEGITPTPGYVYTIAGAGCVSAAVGKTGSVATANSCLTTTGSDAATLGNALGVNVAWTVYLDPNNNVFFSDSGNARIKVIYGGVAPPLTLPNTTYATLQTGFAYSFAGQGTAIASGVPPSQILLGSPQGVGGDANGNIFFMDFTNALIYEAYAQTGTAVLIGGGGAIATAAAGAYCNGGTTGPAMSDAFYNGCPLTQVKMSGTRGPLVADAAGNLYFGDSPGYFIRKFTYNPAFPATAVGSVSAAQPYAFTFTSAKTLAAAPVALVQKGSADGEFADAGGDTCTAGLVATAGTPGTTCVVNVDFKPSVPGARSGGVELVSTTTAAGFSAVNGVGNGAGLTVDPGTSTTTGTGLVPNGIAVDGAGNTYISDLASKSVLESAGGVLSPVLTGLSAPAGVAADGFGDLFVADSNTSTITEVQRTTTTSLSFKFAAGLNNPHGLATDGAGNLYVADTGNNRVVVFGPNATQYTVAGFSGLSAPQAVAVDSSGNLYAADSTHTVKLSAGVQTTIATGGATGVGVDAAGNVLVTSGTTLTEYPAGGGSPIVLSTALVSPKALALDAAGDVFLADSGIAGFVELQRSAGFYQFATSPSSTTIELTSSGNAAVTGSTFTQTDSTDFTLVPATTNGCSGALPAGATCALTAGFSPTLPGTLTDNITFASNAVNATPITLKLTGTTSAQTSTTVLAVSSATLVYGGVQTLTATITGSLSAPTSGAVNFYNNATTLLGTANVGAGGVAVLNFVPGVGAYTVTAVFVPVGVTYFGSTSSAKTFSVSTASLTVSASNASKLYGAANPALSYTITGFVNSDTQATATSGVPAESTTATATSSVGTYPITITQGTLAAPNYTLAFVNGTLTITGATAQTITFAALANATYGAAPVTLAATASSGLAVSYSVSGPATISGAVLTITGAGTVSVTATQTGNNTYAAATPVVQSFTVAKAALTLSATSATRVYGAANPSLAYSFSGFVNGDSQATATSGAPTESTTATTTSAVGSYPITLALGTLASTNYALTLNSGSLTVTPATLTLTANSATRVYGAANPTFTGSLSGTVNGDTLTESFSTSATTNSAPGTYAIAPSATGTNVGNYAVAATNGALTITQAKPTVTLATSAPSGFNGTTSIVLTATLVSPTSGAPTGTVTFSVGGVSVGMATISGGTAVLMTTTLPVGSDSVTAAYAGDTNFTSASSSSILITIAAGFGVSASSTQLSFQINYQEAQTYLTVNPGGRTDTLTFACQGLPSKLSCAFSPSPLALTGLTGPQSVQMLVSNSAATASLKPATETKIALAGLPCLALLIVGLRRRRLPRLLVAALAAGLSAMVFSGCATSPTSYDQAPGSYAFTATVNSGTTTLQTINFTVAIP